MGAVPDGGPLGEVSGGGDEASGRGSRCAHVGRQSHAPREATTALFSSYGKVLCVVMVATGAAVEPHGGAVPFLRCLPPPSSLVAQDGAIHGAVHAPNGLVLLVAAFAGVPGGRPPVQLKFVGIVRQLRF